MRRYLRLGGDDDVLGRHLHLALAAGGLCGDQPRHTSTQTRRARYREHVILHYPIDFALGVNDLQQALVLGVALADIGAVLEERLHEAGILGVGGGEERRIAAEREGRA